MQTKGKGLGMTSPAQQEQASSLRLISHQHIGLNMLSLVSIYLKRSFSTSKKRKESEQRFNFSRGAFTGHSSRQLCCIPAAFKALSFACRVKTARLIRIMSIAVNGSRSRSLISSDVWLHRWICCTQRSRLWPVHKAIYALCIYANVVVLNLHKIEM